MVEIALEKLLFPLLFLQDNMKPDRVLFPRTTEVEWSVLRHGGTESTLSYRFLAILTIKAKKSPMLLEQYGTLANYQTIYNIFPIL